MKNVKVDTAEEEKNHFFYVMDMEYDKGKNKSARTSQIVPEILDICFLKCEGTTGRKLEEYCYKIKPERKLTAFIKGFLHVTDEDYADGLTHEEFVKKVNDDIGRDLLDGALVCHAGDDDYYVWTMWGFAYLKKHPEIQSYDQCPILMLADERCITLCNMTERYSLRTLYKGHYLVCGEMDLSVADFMCFFGMQDEYSDRHNAREDAEMLCKIIQFAGKHLSDNKDYIHLEKFPWIRNEADNPAMQVIEKRISMCRKNWNYLSGKFKKWLLSLDVEDIDWQRAGVPVDQWTGEPLGIGYEPGIDAIRTILKWWGFAYNKPHEVQVYEAWNLWCGRHGKCCYGMDCIE